jgi:uncharacterized protein YbjQ (UPF0145 family)
MRSFLLSVYFMEHEILPLSLRRKRTTRFLFREFLGNSIIKASDLLIPSMLITTTPNIEGKRIKEYLGIVTGEAVVGANLFRDLFAGIRDIVGGRSGAYEKELRRARDLAFEEITEAALELGANAILGVDIDYEVLGEKNGMLMVSVSGTAVIVE